CREKEHVCLSVILGDVRARYGTDPADARVILEFRRNRHLDWAYKPKLNWLLSKEPHRLKNWTDAFTEVDLAKKKDPQRARLRNLCWGSAIDWNRARSGIER